MTDPLSCVSCGVDSGPNQPHFIQINPCGHKVCTACFHKATASSPIRCASCNEEAYSSIFLRMVARVEFVPAEEIVHTRPHSNPRVNGDEEDVDADEHESGSVASSRGDTQDVEQEDKEDDEDREEDEEEEESIPGWCDGCETRYLQSLKEEGLTPNDVEWVNCDGCELNICQYCYMANMCVSTCDDCEKSFCNSCFASAEKNCPGCDES